MVPGPETVRGVQVIETRERIRPNLHLLLAEHVRKGGLGQIYYAPFMVRITPDEPVEPDLVFVSRERAGLIDEQGVQGAPDLVVEIISPSTAGRDRRIKFNRYAQVGIAEYWIVDPIAETVDQFVLGETGYGRMAVSDGSAAEGRLRSEVIAGLDISLSSVFHP